MTPGNSRDIFTTPATQRPDEGEAIAQRRSEHEETSIDPEGLDATRAWLESQKNQLPPAVAATLARLLALATLLLTFKEQKMKVLALLGQVFGMKSKSERRKASSTNTPEPRPPASPEEKARRAAQAAAAQARSESEVRASYDAALKALETSLAPDDQAVWREPLERAAAQPQDTAPSEARADVVFVGGMRGISGMEGRPLGDKPTFTCRAEMLYAAVNTKQAGLNKEFRVTDGFPNPHGRSLQRDWHQRRIWDIEVCFTAIDARVETITDRVTGERLVAEVDLAPPNWQHSYRLISFFVVMAVGFLTPFHRLSRMFSNSEKSFPVSSIWNMVRFAAICCEPIYLEFVRQLAVASHLEGDDTPTRCLAMRRRKAEVEEKTSSPIEDPLPEQPSLVKRLAGPLGRFHKGKRVEEKTGVNLSMVTGRSHGDDERSRIVFYRAHRGSVGDLLGKILSHSPPAQRKRTLKLTCDLSAQNLPSAEARGATTIEVGGCVAHLRRGFHQGRKLEAAADDCRYVLQLIRRLYDVERMARESGNNEQNILWYRQRYGTILWRLIFEKTEEMSRKWLKGTGDLGEHLAYALKNRAAFTAYLADARMPIDNNFCERNLRPEKLHLASSRQRLTEEGRAAFDILLTMVRTCACAQVSPQEWLEWVMRNRAKVALAPEKYTPYAYHLAKTQSKG